MQEQQSIDLVPPSSQNDITSGREHNLELHPGIPTHSSLHKRVFSVWLLSIRNFRAPISYSILETHSLLIPPLCCTLPLKSVFPSLSLSYQLPSLRVRPSIRSIYIQQFHISPLFISSVIPSLSSLSSLFSLTLEFVQMLLLSISFSF